MALSVFIASTQERRALAAYTTQFIQDNYAGRIDPKPWYAHWYSGDQTLDKVRQFAETTDAGIFFWTPDDQTQSRGQTRNAVRDNLVFEAGLFVALHGPARTQILVPKDQHGFLSNVASDFHGVTLQPFTDIRANEEMEVSLEAPLRRVCDRLLSLPPQARAKSPFASVASYQGLERVHTLVGNQPHLESQWLMPLLSTATKIDLINAYRVNEELLRGLEGFTARPGARLRACFIDAWDELVVAIQCRKTSHTPEYIRRAINDSLTRLLRLPDSSDLTAPYLPRGCPSWMRAHYQVFLAKQRLTYTLCRVDDRALIVPLDVKSDKEKRPKAWAISEAICPETFAYYLEDIDKMFNDERLKPKCYDSRET